ncbi:MAG: glycosyltransferase [Bryobacteraceae bacterium]|nr:glycosyltransferase [Bryobacteraceae bacterium]MDW8378661.1 glycosyltransferase [Bryobacterales bacterium]
MKVAFYSPLPPAKSGIADYSAALLEELRKLLDVVVISDPDTPVPPHDLALYQIGNNEHHLHAYQSALEQPGVVVLHEANLHHLICDLTIRRNDWDAYVAEAEYNGGPAARAHAEQVRAQKVGPDYEGVPMLRRLLERSKAAIVHSRFVERQLRNSGFQKPVAVIPHGGWLPTISRRMDFRCRLGLSEDALLVGIFGFLKPYKRIAESLRAFRRVVPLIPDAKMILVGEPHPELPLASLIRSLHLEAHVRLLGFTPVEDFMGYLDAVDLVLNLRYPTVGESSGTLMRALGLGKAVLVSNVGSFAELPDNIVLKVPVDASEEDFLFECLNLLLSRPSLMRQLGRNARRWVEQECSWARVARLYADFLRCVAEGQPWPALSHSPSTSPVAAPAPPDNSASASPGETAPTSVLVRALAELEEPNRDALVEPPPAVDESATHLQDYLKSWACDPDSRQYLQTHLTRLRRTLEIIPPGTAADRILEMGAYLQITPALRTKLGYGEVRGCYLGPAGQIDSKRVVSAEGEEFVCQIDLFNAEKDRFPYPDGHFATVLCCELIEHLEHDPMFLMSEVNRVLRPGGHLVLTTPNIASLRAIKAILMGYHPGFFPAYLKPAASGGIEARHAREYTPQEITMLFLDAGFEVTLLETGPFLDAPRPEEHWIRHLLERYLLSTQHRGDCIYAVGRKVGPVKERYPSWLYQ